ncbi:uncharacterized protein [Diabrotica undecimpunctata]|uniref:uncharacterized protein n=1 Tax=Diabrotica undecimpunctata TaxID=50387 RepID=UPI003B639FC0
MGLVSWIAVKGADVQEVGFNNETIDPVPTSNQLDDLLIEEQMENEPEECTVETEIFLPSTSKRPAESIYVAPKRKAPTKDKGSNLQKAAEAYAVGQKETAAILERFMAMKESASESEQLRQRELDLKEMELKVRWLEAKNKTRELDLRERELDLKERELKIKEKN